MIFGYSARQRVQVRARIGKNVQFFEIKVPLTFFLLHLHKKNFTKAWVSPNFTSSSIFMSIALITFLGHKLKAFFFNVFLLCQIIKGSSNKLSHHPTPCVADHRTATAVTFSLLERYKKYLNCRRRHINSNSSQSFSKIEDGKCFVTHGRTDVRTDGH